MYVYVYVYVYVHVYVYVYTCVPKSTKKKEHTGFTLSLSVVIHVCVSERDGKRERSLQ